MIDRVPEQMQVARDVEVGRTAYHADAHDHQTFGREDVDPLATVSGSKEAVGGHAGLDTVHVTTRVFKDGRIFVAHALELDVSSCGGTKKRALRNVKEAVRLFWKKRRRWAR